MKKLIILFLLSIPFYYSFCQSNKFIRSSNGELILGNSPIKLQGVGLSVRPDNEPQESVYQDIDDMGMNVLRLVFRQSYFYSDDSFSAYNPKIWEWIDKSIGLAKKYDKVLIIHLGRIHGAQFVPRIDVPYDYSIWHDQKKQELFINLWKEIAKRYHKEEIIAGYSLFLEPVCENTTQEWTVLANKTIDNIRKVDTNHLIFIERTYGEFKLRREISGIELAMDNAFPKISDNNFAYEFYMFERDDYTHQFASWRPEPDIRISRKYPDEEKIIIHREETGLTKAFLFNKTYLDFYINKHIKYAESQNIPIMLWGFNTAKITYQNNRGGEAWLKDVMSIIKKLNLHWSYYSYNSTYSGLSDNDKARDIVKKVLVED